MFYANPDTQSQLETNTQCHYMPISWALVYNHGRGWTESLELENRLPFGASQTKSAARQVMLSLHLSRRDRRIGLDLLVGMCLQPVWRLTRRS